MEFTIEYVLYESEKNNEYINKLKPIHNAVKKIKRTENGIIMEQFYDFSKYKNVRTLTELSESLGENEYLIIDLNVIKEEDKKLQEENKLYPKIRETIDENHIVPYVYHDLSKPKKNQREIGEKLYLVKFDETPRNLIGLNESFLVQVKMDKEQTCTWDVISFTSKHKRELDEELSYSYGGFSGLYYLIPEEYIETVDTCYEITKIEDGKWDFVKMNKRKNK